MVEYGALLQNILVVAVAFVGTLMVIDSLWNYMKKERERSEKEDGPLDKDLM